MQKVSNGYLNISRCPLLYMSIDTHKGLLDIRMYIIQP